jgi:predicted adenylyl cyclase CyaB
LPVPDPEEKKRIFGASMGIKSVVRKERSLYLHEGVRIHLDRVDGLGSFLEFEAVLGPALSEEEGRARVADLRARFGIGDEDVVPESYSDLVAKVSASGD